MRKLKTLLPLILIAITALSLVPIMATATDGATVSVDPSTTCVPQGGTFSVDIVVAAVTDMYGFEFKLGYNTAVLTATAIDLTGNMFEPGYFVWKSEIDDSVGYPPKGRVWLAVTQELGAPAGVSGSGLLATITFTVDALGASNLDLYDVDLRDTAGNAIFHTVTDGDFANVPMVSVDPSLIIDTALGVGTTFDVDIVVTMVTDMYGFEFKLGYNTAVLTATAIDLTGNMFEPGYFVWKSEIDDSVGYPPKGRVWLAVTQELGAPAGVSGSGLLATITFTVDALGASNLDLYDVELRDPLGELISPTCVYDGDFTNTAPILWTHVKTKNPYPDWSLGYVGELETLYAPIRNTGTRGAWVMAQFIIRQDATGDTVSMESVETWIGAGDVVTLSTDPFTFDYAGTYHFSVIAWFRPLNNLPLEPYYLYQDILGGLGIAKETINRINVKA